MAKTSGKTGRGVVEYPAKTVQDRVVRFIDATLKDLERQGKPGNVAAHKQLLDTLVRLGEITNALGMVGDVDTWALTMKRCYDLQGKWEGQYEVAEPGQEG